MILVLLGTQNNSFERLLKELDNCITNHIIQDKVIVQAGYTKYTSKNMEILDFIPTDKFDCLLEQADIIITHGGVGSINAALRLNKKIIAIPRLKKYNEHVNDHQIQIVESFNKSGYLIGIFDVKDLASAIKLIPNFVPNKYTSNTQNILNIITNYIDNN